MPGEKIECHFTALWLTWLLSEWCRWVGEGAMLASERGLYVFLRLKIWSVYFRGGGLGVLSTFLSFLFSF